MPIRQLLDFYHYTSCTTAIKLLCSTPVPSDSAYFGYWWRERTIVNWKFLVRYQMNKIVVF